MLYSDWPQVDFDCARWPNFSPQELSCKCGGRYCRGEYWHDPVFLDVLQSLRDRMRAPLIITSAHRCALHNAAVGGAPFSQHKTIAVDVALRGHDPHQLRREAERLGFTGIGLASSFLHLDRRRRPATWFYGPKSRAFWTKDQTQ